MRELLTSHTYNTLGISGGGIYGALSAFFNTNVISSDRTLLQVARAAKGMDYSFRVRFGTSIFLGFKTAIVNNYIFYPSLIIQR